MINYSPSFDKRWREVYQFREPVSSMRSFEEREAAKRLVWGVVFQNDTLEPLALSIQQPIPQPKSWIAVKL